jgi:hypothetical protein
MNYKLPPAVITLFSLIVLFSSCRKTHVNDTSTAINPVIETPAQPPIALAGADLAMTLPLDSLFLSGSSNAPNGVEKWSGEFQEQIAI